jgi:hypothetical protein
MRLGMDGHGRSVVMDGDGRAHADLEPSGFARKVSWVARQGNRKRCGRGSASEVAEVAAVSRIILQAVGFPRGMSKGQPASMGRL